MKIRVAQVVTEAPKKKWYIDYGDRVRPATPEEVALWLALLDKTNRSNWATLDVEVQYDNKK